MNRYEERYIGDGLFVRFDGCAIRLRHADDEIILKPDVLARFEWFVRDVRADLKRWLPEGNEPMTKEIEITPEMERSGEEVIFSFGIELPPSLSPADLAVKIYRAMAAVDSSRHIHIGC